MKPKQWKLYSSMFLIIGTILFAQNKGVSEENCPRDPNTENLFIEGDDFEKQQQYDKAREKYIEALRCDPRSKQYYKKLFKEPYNDVHVLVNNGFYAEAKKKLSDIVQKPDAKNIPPDLKYLFGGQFYEINKFANNIRERFLPVITDFLFFLSIAFILVFIVLRIPIIFVLLKNIFRILGNLFKKRFYLEIKDFNDEAITLKIGKATTAMFKKALVKSGEIGEKPTVDIAFEPIGKFEPPIDLSKTAPPLDILFRLIQSLFPIQSYILSGYCEESEERGFGLTLILKSSKNIITTETFWQQEYDPEMATAKEVGKVGKLLSKPAAIWILFEIDSKAAEKWLGLKTWESYAYSRVGGDWISKNNSNAEKLLQKSLLHEKNRFALFNLGVIKLQDEIKNKNFSKSREYLDIAKEIILDEKLNKKLDWTCPIDWICPINDCSYAQNIYNQYKYNHEEYSKKFFEFNKYPIYIDVVWYKVMYQLAALDEYDLIKGARDKESLLNDNIKYLVEAINCFTCCYKSSNFSIQNSDSDGLKDFLVKFKPMCNIMHASMLVRSERPGSLQQAGKIITEIENEYRVASFRKHDQMFNRNDDQMLSKNGDLSLISSFKKLPNHKEVLPIRAYYNLACYHAARAEISDKQGEHDDEKMFRYLQYTLKQDKALAKWARYDPSFDWVRRQSGKGQRFFEIIGPYF